MFDLAGAIAPLPHAAVAATPALRIGPPPPLVRAPARAIRPPVRPDEGARARIGARGGLDAAPAPAATPARVLVAEDLARHRQALQAALAASGARVAFVENGRAAVHAWREGRFDLVLMDLHMPIMDGRRAAEAIRRDEHARSRARVPIIGLSAGGVARRATDAGDGIDAVMPKPVDVGKLLAVVALATGRRASRRAG